MSKNSLVDPCVPVDDGALAKILEADLVRKYGLILDTEELAEVLAFKSKVAFRHAAYRGHLPVKVFSIEHRKGQFALAKDVAVWIASKRSANSGLGDVKEQPMNSA